MRIILNLLVIIVLFLTGNIFHNQPDELKTEKQAAAASHTSTIQSADSSAPFDCEHFQSINYSAPRATSVVRSQTRFAFLNLYSSFLFENITKNFSVRERILTSLSQQIIPLSDPSCNHYVFALRKIVI